MPEAGTKWHSRARQQSQLALSLATGATWAQAAVDAGLALRTAHRGDSPEFRQHVEQLAASG